MKQILNYLILFSICFSSYTFGQASVLKKANKFYESKAYFEAIPYYEKTLQKDSGNKIILSNLGDCYRLTNNTKGQLLCYGKLVKTGKAEPIHNLYYGQALTISGQQESAKTYFEKYGADSRGGNLASSIDKAKSYSKNADAYKVELATFNSPQNDFCAVKYQDAIVFSSSRSGTQWINIKDGWTGESYTKLYTTKSPAVGEAPKTFMGDLNSKYNDGPICFSKDNNTVYFTRNNSNSKAVGTDGTFKLKIFEAKLNQNGFEKVKELSFNDNNHNCAHPSISADGMYLFFASDMQGGYGGMDIYYSKKEGENWGAVVNLGAKVNTAGNEVFPFIAGNGLLYFSSNGLDGLGGLDVYEAKFENDKVGRAYNMGEPVNSVNDDFGIFLGEDNKIGYLSSNRKSGGMDDDIYTFEILREVKRGKDVLIVIKDKESGATLPNTKFVMNGANVETNDKGEYATILEGEADYSLTVEKNDYFKLEDKVSSKTSDADTFTKELFLEKDPKLFFNATITDARTNALLDGVKITVVEQTTKTPFDSYTTDPTGDYRKALKGKKVGDKISYLFTMEKEGYVPKTVWFIYTIKAPGDINVNKSVNLSIGKAIVGNDLAKLVDFRPIYFETGKAVVRKSVEIELDKIVKVMNEFPELTVELGSHSDCRGSASSNIKLSNLRAKASAAYIISKGIDKKRITGKGYGESKLLNGCKCEGKVKSTCSDEEHAANRRTEFLITKVKTK